MQKKNTVKNVRLSQNVTPIKYEIQLKPDLHNFTFEGIETAYLSLKKSEKILTLHSRELDIETASVATGGEKIFAKISYNEKSEMVNFIFPKAIPAGRRELTLVFKGILNDKMRGFYRSRYNIGSIEYNMATTQFEATDARRAFPCIDEPARKAVFNVSLIVPKGKTAISNTLPVSRMEHEAGYEIVRFSPTPKMSTYLVAFIVGDFEHIKKKTKHGVEVRVFTVPGKKHQAKFALDCAARALDFYEDYFAIPYPLPVLDMIAIPDFSTAAMENWGAVTYRETALLVDEKNSSVASKQWIAGVITHELAHQWFGNLVTMEWWTHLWLNEGFATFIGYFAQDKLYPHDDVWNQFVSGVAGHGLGRALQLDALASTHPVEIIVHHPSEIGEVFDTISYDKGASVIRMIAEYLGPKDFRDGLRYYLKKHSYKNTSTVHLWQAFERISGKPVTAIMYGWIAKPGHPVVSVSEKNNKLEFTQSRFFSSPISKAKTRDKTLWQVPILYGDDEKQKKVILSSKSAEIRQNTPWTKLNLGESGVFRTAYSKILLEKLRMPVEKKLLPAVDRLGIVRDLFALSEAGIIPTTDALSFLSAYKHEDEYTVWAEIATGIGALRQLLAKENQKENFDRFVLSFFGQAGKKLGWNKKKGEPDSVTLLRSLVLSILGRAGDTKIIAEAKRKFAGIKKGTHIDADLRGATYSIVASVGGAKEYNNLVRLYKKETLHEEKDRIGGALGGFRDKKILKQVCNFAISKDVRIQDSWSILFFVGRNPIGRDLWWNFVKKNWNTLVSRYGDGGMALSSVVRPINTSPEKKHLDDYKKFFSTHAAPGGERSVRQVIERMESNIAWLERDGKKIAEFLKK